MIDFDSLYKELKADFDQLVGPLFELAEQHVLKSDGFYPFGATLERSGAVGLDAAWTGEERPDANELLELLHDGLRMTAKKGEVAAVAVCEWVKITVDGGRQADAMKVLVEHERGLSVAFYVPCHKQVSHNWHFEGMFARQVEPEIKAWVSNRAS